MRPLFLGRRAHRKAEHRPSGREKQAAQLEKPLRGGFSFILSATMSLTRSAYTADEKKLATGDRRIGAPDTDLFVERRSAGSGYYLRSCEHDNGDEH